MVAVKNVFSSARKGVMKRLKVCQSFRSARPLSRIERLLRSLVKLLNIWHLELHSAWNSWQQNNVCFLSSLYSYIIYILSLFHQGDNLKTMIYLFFKEWLAFEDLHRPLFREHGSIYFANGNKPSKYLNYAFCEVCLAWLVNSVVHQWRNENLIPGLTQTNKRSIPCATSLRATYGTRALVSS